MRQIHYDSKHIGHYQAKIMLMWNGGGGGGNMLVQRHNAQVTWLNPRWVASRPSHAPLGRQRSSLPSLFISLSIAFSLSFFIPICCGVVVSRHPWLTNPLCHKRNPCKPDAKKNKINWICPWDSFADCVFFLISKSSFKPPKWSGKYFNYLKEYISQY